MTSIKYGDLNNLVIKGKEETGICPIITLDLNGETYALLRSGQVGYPPEDIYKRIMVFSNKGEVVAERYPLVDKDKNIRYFNSKSERKEFLEQFKKEKSNDFEYFLTLLDFDESTFRFTPKDPELTADRITKIRSRVLFRRNDEEEYERMLQLASS